ncbi:SnoaL-like domain protein [Clavibacter michiganensis]|uniref:SnoaL-like domain protein n=1 Tax=Clavibacter michiganensis TaxID=28447 RepID=A0A251YHT8_9MICO|nr:nuclear transport factor 2 family protein [Clavibacter michiganensis]OUE23812.1 SnoaL-like domain protein [Clavibacter michiganensis]
MPDPLVARYLAALEHADVPAALALFSPDGVVHSPLYGILPAARFYPALFADTGASRLRLRRVMRADDEGTPTIAFWFDFDWVLANGERAPFSVVDVAELDAEGRIMRLHIVYDTAPLRPSFDRQRAQAAAEARGA